MRFPRADGEVEGQAETGGVLRLGIVHYNTAAEIDRLVEALAEIASTRP